jgi:hypothetical protein
MTIPDALGKSEGLVAFGIATFATCAGLTLGHVISGDQFVNAVGLILASVFGGSAAAAYRK